MMFAIQKGGEKTCILWGYSKRTRDKAHKLQQGKFLKKEKPVHLQECLSTRTNASRSWGICMFEDVQKSPDQGPE